MRKKNTHKTPIRAVLLDGMNTVAEPKGSRKKLLATIYSDELKRQIDPDRLWQITEEVRQIKVHTLDGRFDWNKANRLILHRLGVSDEQIKPETIERMRRRIFYDYRLYKVRPDMRRLLEGLAGLPIILGIDSNQDEAGLDIMLTSLNIKHYFRLEYIFTSQRLGDLFKPCAKHFEKIAEMLNLPPEQIVLVGNNLHTDAGATQLGERVIIFDRERRWRGKFKNFRASLPREQQNKLFIRVQPKNILFLIQSWLKKLIPCQEF